MHPSSTTSLERSPVSDTKTHETAFARDLRARAARVPENVDAQAVLHEIALESDFEQHVTQQLARATAPVRAPKGRFIIASTVWALATFGICYVALPTGFALAGGSASVLPWRLPADFVAFGLSWTVVALWMWVRSIRTGTVRVDLQGLAASDRIPAAMAGGLLVWGVLHNTLPGLNTFETMSLAFLGFFLVANILENALFGTVLGAIARTRRGAFVAGALLQLSLILSAWIL